MFFASKIGTTSLLTKSPKNYEINFKENYSSLLFQSCLRAHNSDMRGHVSCLLQLCGSRTVFNIFSPAFERKCLRDSKRALVFSNSLSFYINRHFRSTQLRCSVLFKLSFSPSLVFTVFLFQICSHH